MIPYTRNAYCPLTPEDVAIHAKLNVAVASNNIIDTYADAQVFDTWMDERATFSASQRAELDLEYLHQLDAESGL